MSISASSICKYKNKLTQSELRDLLEYNYETGVFRRKQRTSKRIYIGDVAGYLDKSGYVYIKLLSEPWAAHRLAWLYVYGQFPCFQIDHINHKKSDNRIINLRDVTNSDNQKNSTLRKSNRSGFPGVFWNKNTNKWNASIMSQGKRFHLGSFDNKEDAVLSRKEAEIKHLFHANHGSNI